MQHVDVALQLVKVALSDVLIMQQYCREMSRSNWCLTVPWLFLAVFSEVILFQTVDYSKLQIKICKVGGIKLSILWGWPKWLFSHAMFTCSHAKFVTNRRILAFKPLLVFLRKVQEKKVFLNYVFFVNCHLICFFALLKTKVKFVFLNFPFSHMISQLWWIDFHVVCVQVRHSCG